MVGSTLSCTAQVRLLLFGQPRSCPQEHAGSPLPLPPLPPPLPPRLREGAEEQESICPICLGEIQNAKTLEKCRHSFCEGCITRALQVKKACPMCGRFYGQLVGNQPQNGRMLVSKDATLLLPSYEKYGTIVIQYVFPPGVQGVRRPQFSLTDGFLHVHFLT